jgi:AcrR family transcriptional regulator
MASNSPGGLNTEFVRSPKQDRSRKAFDRVIGATVEILKADGLQQLTLAEVSRRSDVSIGSIYCRVDSKEDLIRVVQAHVLESFDHEFAVMLNRIRRKSLPLRDLVPAMVRELAAFLRRHAALLSAFMQQGARDPLVASVGRKSHLQTSLDFKLLLLERQAEFHHPDPDHAATTIFTVVYGCLARYLGLGAHPESGAGEGDWNRLIEDLGLMALAFLVVDLKAATQPAKHRERPAEFQSP